MASDGVCAFARDTSLSFKPRACSSNASDTAGALRCEDDRAKLRGCPLLLAHSSDLAVHKTRQRRLISQLHGHSLAVVGDSMARQAFVTLVARLRGLDAVADFNVHHKVRFVLFRGGSGLVADALDLPHLPLPRLAGRTARTWAIERIKGSHEHGAHPALEVDYVWAPCSHNMRSTAAEFLRDRHARRRNWTRVVLFAPAYWHLAGACGAAELKPSATMAVWAPWVNVSASLPPSINFTIVNAPTENLRAAWEPKQLRLNQALAERFAAGDFPPNFSLFDWASLMRRARPPTVVPLGDQKATWHYACQFYRQASWYTMSTRHNVSMATHAAGDCAEDGATPLWDQLIGG